MLRALRLLPITLFAGLALAAAVTHGHAEARAQADTQLARLVALRQDDLGSGWRVAKAPPVAWVLDDGTDAEKTPAHVAVASTGFVSAAAGARAESVVTVLPTVPEADVHFARVTQPAFVRGIRKVETRYFAKLGGTVLSVRRVHAREVGDRSVTYRLLARFRVKDGVVPTVADLVYFQRGRTFVALSFMRSVKPFAGAGVVAARVAARA